ncbi:SH3 domain-containing protein [Budviciaceae bacterium BWR-B9]|uniref:SH3 domain-containing protein n=1 Tax=Limnobaculum allomyrinae TaxID=2791986 RepID=A0ABS1IMN2_9GAMM|nr:MULTISPECIES: TIGR04211 family SH3 domain-containing protein [Limnobaculum]MBK5143010.1 SH3 domain-containing protein [Limnobaculum allomyrinae]MBV7693340.1 SH3 domain-containing protein [Limnobaculum sp. M2-1]
MLNLRTISIALLASLSMTSFTVAADTRYISDNLNTYLRGGPSDNYRLTGTINAGEKVELLAVNDTTKYGQIQDSKGRTAWIPLDQLSTAPSLSERVPALEQQVKDLTDKLTNIDNSWNQRTADMQEKVANSDGIINGLKQENQQLKDELAAARKKVSDISLQMDDKQRTIIQQWFMYGGGVAGVGLILGLLLPYLIPRRKKDRWMN